MASEIRVNRLSNRSGLSTITFANGGVQFSGITTFANGDFRVGTGATILNPSANEMQFHTGGSNRFTINNSGANLGTGNITAVDATFTGNVSIGKTLTYEDVKNVDSVGVVTARTGVKITGGDLTVGTAITASSVTGNVTQDVGITTFSGSATWFKGTTANKDMYWSKSSGSLIFKDNAAALFGDSSDLQISHDGSNSYIKDSGTGGLRLCADEFNVKNAANNEVIIRGTQDSGVELYHNNSKKLESTSLGAKVSGDLQMGGTAGVRFHHTGTTSIFETQTAGDSLLFKTTPSGGSTTERLRITSDGRIGINDSSPSDYELDIQNRSGVQDVQLRLYNSDTTSTSDTIMRYQIGGTTANNYIYFGDSGDSNAGQIRYSHSNDFLSINTAAAERVRITAGGQLCVTGTTSGVDTTPPLNGFSAHYETDQGQVTLGTYSSGGTTHMAFYTNESGNAMTQKMCLQGNGSLGLGVDTPTAGDLASGASFAIPKMMIQGPTSDASHHLLRLNAGQDADYNASILTLNHSNDRGIAIYGGRSTSNRSWGAVKAIDNIGRVSNCINMIGGSGQGVNRIEFYTGESTSTTERLRIESDGKLILKNNSGMMMDLQSSAGTGANYIEFSDTDGTRKGYFGYGSSSTEKVYWVQQKSANMSMYSNGNDRFEVQSDGTKLIKNGRLTIVSTFIDFSGSINYTPSTAAAIFRPADNTLAFSTANTERLRIDSNGSLLMGNTAATFSSPTPSINIEKTSTGTGPLIFLYNGQSANTASTCEIRVGQNYREANRIVFGRENNSNWQSSAASTASYMGFYTNSAGTLAERLRIDSNGVLTTKQSSTNTTSSNWNGAAFSIQNTHDTDNNASVIWFRNSAEGCDCAIQGIHQDAAGTGGSRRGHLQFGTSGANSSGSVVERLRITSEGQLLHTRSDNTTRYDLEFINTGGISDGNYGGIHWTQGNGSTNLAAIEIAYANSGRPDIVFKNRQSGGTSISEALRLNSSGYLTIPNQPSCTLYEPHAIQINTSNDDVPIGYQHVEHNDGMTVSNGGSSDSTRANSRIQVPVAGRYFISAAMSGSLNSAAAVDANDGIIWYLRKNGGNSSAHYDGMWTWDSLGSTTGMEFEINFSIVLQLAANDYLEVAYTNIHTNFNINLDKGYFSVHLLS